MEQTTIIAALLGLLEGLTEFIPVSSTGHVLLAGHFLGFESTGKAFEVVIQLGAILAILGVYAKKLIALFAAAPSDPVARRTIYSVLIAFMPAVVIGVLAHDFIKTVLFETPMLIAVMLILGGFALIALERFAPLPKHFDAMELSWKTSLLIGLLLNVGMRSFEFLIAIPALTSQAPHWGRELFVLTGASVGVMAFFYMIAFAFALHSVTLFPRMLGFAWLLDILIQLLIAQRIGAMRDLPGNALLLGEMGIGNTSSASLLMARLTGESLDVCTGRGTGLDDGALAHKRAVLQEVLARHPDATSPLAALAALGGFEIAQMVGAVLQAATENRVILVDGFITTSAVLVAARLQPLVLQRCVYSHQSDEAGHVTLLRHLEAQSLLQLGLRLGEGSGAALAWPLLASACAILCEMASFDGAGVSDSDTDAGQSAAC